MSAPTSSTLVSGAHAFFTLAVLVSLAASSAEPRGLVERTFRSAPVTLARVPAAEIGRLSLEEGIEYVVPDREVL